MRIVPGFMVREIAGETIAIPSGEAARHLSGLVALSGSGQFLFELLQTEQTMDTLIETMCNEYDVDEATARTDIREFLDILRENDMLVDSSRSIDTY